MNEQKNTNTLRTLAIAVAVLAVACVTAVIVVALNLGGNKLEKHLNLGQKYLSEGNYKEAIAEFEATLEIDPMCVDAYKGLSEAYMELKDYDAAREVLEEALELFEEEGTKSDVKKIRRLLDKIYKADLESGRVTVAEVPEEAPAEETAAAEDALSNRDILNEYYDDVMNRGEVIPTYEAFTMDCIYIPSSGTRGEYITAERILDGYINGIFYDINMDGEDELILAKYTANDSIDLEIMRVENGRAVLDFTVTNINAFLFGVPGDWGYEQSSVCIGVCTKGGKAYITIERKAVSSLFADGADLEMIIYEINGNNTNTVFESELIGSDFSDYEEFGGVEADQNKLRGLGFNATANELTSNLEFSAGEGITPVVFGCSRHSSTYNPDFDYQAFWEEGANPDPGQKAFIFTAGKEEGYSIIDADYPTWWWY